MAATPQYGGFRFVNAKSGMTINVDAYISDVANASVTFDSGAGASSTSNTFYNMPGDNNTVWLLEDFYIKTGTADTTKLKVYNGALPSQSTFRYASHLDTLGQRPSIKIAYRGGDTLRAIQLA